MRDGYRGVLANPQIRFLSECRHEMAQAVLDARTAHAFPASNSSNEQPIIVRVRAEPVEERPDPRDPVRRSTVAGSFVYRSNVFQSIFERPNISVASTRRSSFRRAAEGSPVPVCGAFPDSSGAWD